MNREKTPVLILGGGLAGLSAGLVLTRSGRTVLVLERESAVGGLAKTAAHGPFRFDLGGHRFHTKNENIEAFLRELMGGELLTVPRKSQILLGDRYFDYPLRPLNAIWGLGIGATCRILCDYAIQRVKGRLKSPRVISLEDWVVSRFGRTLFEIYFKEYSEKIWGIACDRICMEWVEQRIQGLSLGSAITTALFRSAGRDVPTLVEQFLYPRLGIGRIAERIKEEIEREGRVLTNVQVERLEHGDSRVERLIVADCGRPRVFEGDEFVSTIPMTLLVGMLDPRAPADVLDAAAKLRYRDLVIVAVMVDRARVTDQTWMYIPERRVPFGRIHEPTNWSPRMAPEGKTLLVTEHFCFSGDETWTARDDELVEVTIAHLARLGFIEKRQVVDSAVLRVPKAYPLFELGYEAQCGKIYRYLSRFKNLHLTGRSGMFKYLNMDHAIAAGFDAAERVASRTTRAPETGRRGLVPAGARE